MKKFLSLVLALVMTMSLVTISAGAKEFTDDDTITYDEAINVISTIGVVDGYADGSFRPTDVLTRGAAAKIICNLILGPTTAAELHATTAPFKDVPTSNTFAGYIAYCAKEGIISGYADGTFRPSGTLTGYAFMKMLLGALNYDAEIEGYTGANWSINVAKQALAIGLNKGLEGDFNGIQAVTRQDACLYAFNTLQADLVEYDTTISATLNGQTVTIGNSQAKAQKWNSSATRINNIKNDEYIQFAEQYFNKLQKKDDTDAFGRPAYTWVYDKKEIGTYVDYTTLVAEYSEKVTGKDLYEEITKSVLDDSNVLIYVDGIESNSSNKAILGDAYFVKGNIVKTNTEKVGETGNGVLTQVFVDTDADEVIIAIINTYLAKAEEDYDEKNNEIDLKVFNVTDKGSRTKILVKDDDDDDVITVDGEDFAIEDIEEDDLFLVTVADGEIQTIEEPEILSEAIITSFKKTKNVTSDGTQYDYADTARYDEEVLDEYDQVNMKETTYNIILDQYGYLIGLEQNEDPNQYAFVTGIDGNTSNLSSKNADVNLVFLDGTMDTVKVDTKKSAAFIASISGRIASQVNSWVAYTVSSDGVYTLKVIGNDSKATNATVKKVAQSSQNATTNFDINKKHVSLEGSTVDFDKVYGNDDTVYLNLELKTILTPDDGYRDVVDDVESVTTGVKNVDLTVRDLGNAPAPTQEVYTLYKNNGYVIAAVTLEAENNGTTISYAYITGEVEREDYDSSADEWTWHKEAVVNGELVKLTEVGDTLDVLDDSVTEVGKWYEIRYDADGNVRSVKQNDPAQYAINFNYGAPQSDKFAATVSEIDLIDDTYDTILLHADYTGTAADGTPIRGDLSYKNGTFYTNTAIKEGFSVSAGVKVVLGLNGTKASAILDDVTDGLNGYDGLEKALRNLNSDQDNFKGYISAIIEDGVATTIILDDRTPADAVNTGIDNSGDVSDAIVVVSDINGNLTVHYYGATPSTDDILANIQEFLTEEEDVTIEDVIRRGGGYTFKCTTARGYDVEYYFNPSTNLLGDLKAITVDGDVLEYFFAADGLSKEYDISKYAKTGNYYKWTNGNTNVVSFWAYTSKFTAGYNVPGAVVTGYIKADVSAISGAAVTDSESDGTDNYVKAGSVEITGLTTGTTYEVTVGSKTVTAVAKNNAITITATDDITAITAVQTQEDLETAVATAISNANVQDKGDISNGDDYEMTISGDTITITVAANKGATDVNGTGLGNVATELLTAGNTIKVSDGSTTVNLSGSVTAANLTALRGLFPAESTTKTLTVTVTGTDGATATYYVELTQN